MNNYIVWNIDPVIADIGPLQLRYYGILFATAILIGFYLARRIYRKYGFPDKIADDLLIWGVVATVIGARLVHCLFYEPAYYLSNPLEILKVYKGGIASHGATVGLVFAVIFISRKYKVTFTDLADGVVFPGIMGAVFVRLGNFFNSEIVGKITTVPWGFKFLRNPDDMKLAINAATGHCDISKMECLINYCPSSVAALRGFRSVCDTADHAHSFVCQKRSQKVWTLYGSFPYPLLLLPLLYRIYQGISGV